MGRNVDFCIFGHFRGLIGYGIPAPVPDVRFQTGNSKAASGMETAVLIFGKWDGILP